MENRLIDIFTFNYLQKKKNSFKSFIFITKIKLIAQICLQMFWNYDRLISISFSMWQKSSQQQFSLKKQLSNPRPVYVLPMANLTASSIRRNFRHCKCLLDLHNHSVPQPPLPAISPPSRPHLDPFLIHSFECRHHLANSPPGDRYLFAHALWAYSFLSLARTRSVLLRTTQSCTNTSADLSAIMRLQTSRGPPLPYQIRMTDLITNEYTLGRDLTFKISTFYHVKTFIFSGKNVKWNCMGMGLYFYAITDFIFLYLLYFLLKTFLL